MSSSVTSLPIVLVSAGDKEAANSIISELVNNEIPLADGDTPGRVWKIVNKYYSADVKLIPLADSGEPLEQGLDAVEAHVVYLNKDECNRDVAEKRAAASNDATDCDVKLLVTETVQSPKELVSWAHKNHFDLIPLREVRPDGIEEDEDSPFPEVYGVERARTALHAHAWTNHVRVDRSAPRILHMNHEVIDTEDLSDESSDGEDHPEDEEGAVERAEDFADALNLMSNPDWMSNLSQEERLARAEALVTAFCRALGHDLNGW